MKKRIALLFLIATLLCSFALMACNTSPEFATQTAAPISMGNCDLVGHTASDSMTVYTESTCRASGLYQTSCIHCGSFILVPMPTKPHIWELDEAISEPTEFENGSHRFVCHQDHEPHYETRTIAALGEAGHIHSWSEWTTTIASTCQSEGEETRHCELNSGHMETRIAPKHGHNYGNWKTKTHPTETHEGVEEEICNICDGKLNIRSLPALGSPALQYAPYQSGDHDGYLITGIADTQQSKIYIPSHHSGKPVYAIAEHAFSDSSINEIEFLPNSKLEIIGDYAFNNSLAEKIVIPKSVKEIRSFAFAGLQSLYKLSFEEGSALEKIGSYAFSSLNISELNLPTTLKEVGENLLYKSTPRLRFINNGKSPNYVIESGCLVEVASGKLLYAREDSYNTQSFITMPQLARRIPDKTFEGREDIIGIQISYKIERIGDYAFSDCKNLKKAVGLDDAKEIGMYAFNNCESLRSVSKSEDTSSLRINAEIVGDYAFQNCIGFSKAEIYSAKKLGKHIFYGCNFSSLFIDNGDMESLLSVFDDVTTILRIQGDNAVIPDSAFENSTKLKTLYFSGKSIGKNAFANSVIETVYVTVSSLILSERAFYNCPNLKLFDVVNSSYLVQSQLTIKKEAFRGCSSLNSFFKENAWYDAGYAMDVIEEAAFYGCSSLNDIIYVNAKRIEKDAFTGTNTKQLSLKFCESIDPYAIAIPSLTKLYLKDCTFTKESEGVFAKCVNLSNVSVSGLFSTAEGLFKNQTSITTLIGDSYDIAKEMFMGCKNITEGQMILYGVVGDSAFEGCTGLTNNMFFGSDFKAIGNKTFKGCTELSFRDLNFLTRIEHLGESAFEGCKKLSVINDSGRYPDLKLSPHLQVIPYSAFRNAAVYKVILPQSIREIGQYAFSNSTITEINLNNVLAIRSFAFSSATNLKNLGFTDNFLSESLLDSLEDFAFQHCKNLSLKILYDQSKISFSSDAFNFCQSVEIIIRKDVEVIPAEFAEGNRSVTKITLESGSQLTEIEDRAFNQANNLAAFYFPGTLKRIGTKAFAATKIETIRIPGSVEYIADRAFENCFSVTSIKFDANVSNLTSFNFGEIFYGCDELMEIQLPENLTKITEDVFEMRKHKKTNPRHFDSLRKVTLSTKTTEIGNYAFYHMKALTNVYNCENVEMIGDNAFAFSRKLEQLEFRILKAPNALKSIGDMAFYDCQNFVGINVVVDKLETIGKEAFYSCFKASFFFYPSLHYIGERAFEAIPNTCWAVFHGNTSFEGAALRDRLKATYPGAFYYTNIQLIGSYYD